MDVHDREKDLAATLADDAKHRYHDLIDIDESFSMWHEVGCFSREAKHDPFA